MYVDSEAAAPEEKGEQKEEKTGRAKEEPTANREDLPDFLQDLDDEEIIKIE